MFGLNKFLLCLLAIMSGCLHQTRQVLKIGNGIEPTSLDPHIAPGLAEAKVICALFEGLLVPSSRTLEPMPGMAESYTISPDKTEYTFLLRDNIFWSDGSRVVAKNFADSVKRGLSKSIASPWVEQYFVLKNAKKYYDGEIVTFSKVGVDVISDRKLRFTLEKPLDYFLSLLTHWAWYPVNRRYIERYDGFFDRSNRWTKPTNIVTNGPFLLKSTEIGDKIVVKKNPKYWDAQNVAIDEIHFISGIDVSTEENMFKTGALDITDNVSTDKISTYNEQGLLKSSPTLGSSFFWFNCQKKPFDDVRVRMALSLAVDRNAIGKLRGRGPDLEARCLIPGGTMNYFSKNLFSDDVLLARSLLAEAGYPDGKNFPVVTLLYNTSENWKIISEAIQEMWRKNLGINVELQSLEWSVFLNERRNHQFDICRGGWIGDYNDASTFLNLFKSSDNNNHASWKNEKYDTLLANAENQTDIANREKVLKNAEALLIQDMPIIPLYFDATCHLVSNRVGGWHANILDWHALKFVYFK